jgi:hypothetical protein
MKELRKLNDIDWCKMPDEIIVKLSLDDIHGASFKDKQKARDLLEEILYSNTPIASIIKRECMPI